MLFRTVIVLAILASVSFASRDFTIEDYTTRQTVIQKLDAIYDQYRLTNRNHRETRKRLVESFLSTFKGQFNGSDEWLLEASSSDDGIVQETMEANGVSYPQTKAFIESVFTLYGKAGLQRIRFAVHSNNYTEAERLEGEINDGKTEIQKKLNETLDLIRTKLYLAQFPADVMDSIKNHGQSVDLPDLLVRRLKQKFPFRSWVAILFEPSLEEHYMCSRPDIFQTNAYSRRLILFHVDVAAKSNRKLASSLLDKVAVSKKAWWHSCDGRGEEILKEEAKYDCSRKVFMFAGVFESENGFPTVAASDVSLISRKLVYRARLTFFCKAYFDILFLG